MSEYTPTYILTWSPKVFKWDSYKEMVSLVKSGIFLDCDWSCRSKKLREGDRFILLMQGMGKKNGVIGHGVIKSAPYELPFSDSRYVDIKFNVLLDYEKDKYVRTEVLRSMFPEQCFTPQSSGIRVKSSILPDLWKLIGGRNDVKDCDYGI